MKNYKINSAGTRCLAETETEWYDLTTREYCPLFHRLDLNRALVPLDRPRRRKLKNNIREKEMVLLPILCDKDYNIYDGHQRWKIVNELWDEGVNVKVGFTVNPWLNEDDPIERKRDNLISLQENTPWSPYDKLKSLADFNNETAQCILKLAYEPVTYTKKGIYGIRSAFVAMGRNPDDFDTLPVVLSPEDYELSQRIFNETNYLLTLGIKATDKANNWTEAFIKAWRRIRINDPKLAEEDENGDRAPMDTNALNAAIEDVGLDTIGSYWRLFADKAYASGKVGRWAMVLGQAILAAYDRKHSVKIA
jgi:hypothetical protein